jgi:two-component system, sensor histidine kinase ChiS
MQRGPMQNTMKSRMLPNRCRRLVARLMVCASVAMLPVAFAASPEALPQDCRRIAAIALPDAATCERRFGATRVTDAAERFRTEADARIRAGDFDTSRIALNCAQAFVAEDDWRGHYETLRRYGVLEYRRERIPDALIGFECALAIAERREDRAGIAKQTKNIGAALLRLGDYRGAQRSLERSLAIQRADSNPAIGSALNNLADMYREQDDITNALRYYHEALNSYRRQGDDIEATHTLETMSVIALDRGDTATAIGLLNTALREYRAAGHRSYQLRVYAGLARAALLEGDVRAARRWSADGLALAAELGLTVPAHLHLQTARIERAEGRSADAATRLQAALATLPPTDPDRIALLEEQGLALADIGEYPQAIAALRDANRVERRDAQARFDRQIGWQRSRFEAGERERTIATLKHENRQRELSLWLMAVSALALLLMTSMFLLRRQQHARIAEAARRARDEEALERYRREAEALQVDRRLLRTLLATRENAMCMLDINGDVLVANEKACALLQMDEAALLGAAFAARLDARDRAAWSIALDSMDEMRSFRLRAMTCKGIAIEADIAQWDQDGGVLMLELRVAAAIHPDEQAETTPVETAPTEDSSERPQETEMSDAQTASESHANQRYRRDLVELMLAAVEDWERGTGSNRIELAERSRIWRVNIDDGRLRARVMERYLTLSKLPRNPRWRDVLRTAYYVLGHCPLDTDTRARLQALLDTVLAHHRRSALQ